MYDPEQGRARMRTVAQLTVEMSAAFLEELRTIDPNTTWRGPQGELARGAYADALTHEIDLFYAEHGDDVVELGHPDGEAGDAPDG